MWRRLAVLFLLVCTMAVAEKKPEEPYSDAVLDRFVMVDEGAKCSTNEDTTGQVSNSGSVAATSRSTMTCVPRKKALYTITVAGQTLVISPDRSAVRGLMVAATLGVGAAFLKDSALYGQLPGAKFQIRSEGSGIYKVRVGKRTSTYKLVSAE